MRSAWNEIELGDVLDRKSQSCEILPDLDYKEITVALWGKGVRLRRKVAGAEIGANRRNVASMGDFIISKIDARHGAYGFVSSQLDGGVVTNDFPLYRVNESICESRWIYWISRSAFFVNLCKSASEGSTNRVRLKETRFESLEVPLPPLAEQRRIVAHLDAIESRLNRVRNLREERAKDSTALTISLHHGLSGGRVVRMEDLLILAEEKELVAPTGSYPQLGIRSFGNGLFKKPAVAGSDTSYRTFNVLRPGMFVMSQVKGWEGAVAVCQPNLEGWFVSPEYRTFGCIEGFCDPDYLSFLVKTDWFHRQLAGATRGQGARRERVRPEMLLNLEMPFPTLKNQRKAVQLLQHLDTIRKKASAIEVRDKALMPSILDRIFTDHDTTGLDA